MRPTTALLCSSLSIICPATVSQRHRHHHHPSLLILKLPKSGSTWFTSLIRDLSPRVHITKEAINKFDMRVYSVACISGYLTQALCYPSSPLHFNAGRSHSCSTNCSCRHQQPDDNRSTTVCATRGEARVVGLTMSPVANCCAKETGMDWTYPIIPAGFAAGMNSALRQNHAKVIIYHRTNAMKQALASTSSHAGAQRLDRPRVFMDPAVVLSDAKRWLRRNELLRELEVHAREATTPAGLLLVAYEEVQLDTPAVLHRVAAFLELRTAGVFVPVSQYSGGDRVAGGQTQQGRRRTESNSNSSTTTTTTKTAVAAAIHIGNTSIPRGQKRSSEDLRELIMNFEDVRGHVAVHAPCLLPQLLSTTPRIFESGACRADDITAGLAEINKEFPSEVA